MSEDKSLSSSGLGAPKGESFGLSRRTVLAGAAWSVPAILVAQSASAVAVSCYPVGSVFRAQSRGILLSGVLAGVNLNDVVELQGEFALVPDQGSPEVTKFGSTNVSVLNTINASATGITGLLSSILTLAAPAPVGILDQFARANIDGNVRGAAGAVDMQGQLEFNAASPSFPDFGSLDLRVILAALAGPVAAAAIANVSNLTLQIGAVTGRAALQSACVPGADNLQRDYQITRLNLVLSSAVLTAIVAAINATLNAILALSTILVPITVTGTAIFAGNIPGADQPIQAQLSANPATITVDLASLLGPAPGQPGNTPFGTFSAYLNSLPPNSTLFVDNNLQLPATAVTTFTTALVATLTARLQANIFVDGVPLSAASGLIVATINGLLNTLLNVTLAPLVGQLQTLVLSPVFAALSGVINIDVNAQNRSTNPPGPAVWDGFAGGRYDVAALYIRALGALDVLDLFISRGSVGENVRTGP